VTIANAGHPAPYWDGRELVIEAGENRGYAWMPPLWDKCLRFGVIEVLDGGGFAGGGGNDSDAGEVSDLGGEGFGGAG